MEMDASDVRPGLGQGFRLRLENNVYLMQLFSACCGMKDWKIFGSSQLGERRVELMESYYDRSPEVPKKCLLSIQWATLSIYSSKLGVTPLTRPMT